MILNWNKNNFDFHSLHTNDSRVLRVKTASGSRRRKCNWIRSNQRHKCGQPKTPRIRMDTSVRSSKHSGVLLPGSGRLVRRLNVGKRPAKANCSDCLLSSEHLLLFAFACLKSHYPQTGSATHLCLGLLCTCYQGYILYCIFQIFKLYYLLPLSCHCVSFHLFNCYVDCSVF